MAIVTMTVFYPRKELIKNRNKICRIYYKEILMYNLLYNLFRKFVIHKKYVGLL